MAVVFLDRNVAVAWCTAIASVTAPTVSEINAGTRAETLITPDGLMISPRNNKTNAGNLGSKYTWERFGRVGYDVKITFHHDSAADTGWTLFPFRTAGFLVVRRGIDRSTAFASTQGGGGALGTLVVLPLECGMADEKDPSEGALWDFDLEFALTADPGDRAIVA